jgi:hypothetical protein
MIPMLQMLNWKYRDGSTSEVGIGVSIQVKVFMSPESFRLCAICQVAFLWYSLMAIIFKVGEERRNNES